MQVEVIEEATSPDPERAVCLAARNDYYAGNIMDDDFAEVMDGVGADMEDTNAVDGTRPDRATEAQKRALIRKLLRREHYGPFETPQLAVHASGVSRVTMAQITRHRHLSFDIQSQRYVDFEDADYTVPPSLEDPDHFSRETGAVDFSDRTRRRMQEVYTQQVEAAFEAYNNMVDAGVPKEDARYVLPNCAEVNMVISGNLRAWLHVVNMRMKADAQAEVRDLSEMVCEHIAEWAPITYEWFDDNAPVKLGL